MFDSQINQIDRTGPRSTGLDDVIEPFELVFAVVDLLVDDRIERIKLSEAGDDAGKAVVPGYTPGAVR